MAFGSATMVQGGLGTSPISSWPAVMREATPLSFGELNMLISVIFVALQIVLLGRRFQLAQLLIQLPMCVVYGFFCDIGVELTNWVHAENYLLRWVVTIVGALIMGLGVYVQVLPKIAYLPGEGLVMAIALVSKRSFGTCKQAFDWSMVIISVICSLIFCHGLVGVREGTIFSAFAIGGLVEVYTQTHAAWRRQHA